MPAVVIIRSHGATIAVRGPRAELDAIVAETEPSGGERVDGDDGAPVDAIVSLRLPSSVEPGEVRRGDDIVAESHDPDEVRRIALSETHLAIAAHARDGVFVHAGAVSWRGAGIVLPGRSMAGKSTLVRELVGRGATYFSDEYAVIGSDGGLRPYLKPIARREGGGHIAGVSLDEIERTATAVVPVVVVARLTYGPSPQWPPSLVEGAPAVLPLVDNAVAARLAPDRVLDAVTSLVGTATVWSGERPDAAIAAEWLIEVVERGAASGPDHAPPPAA